MGKVRNSVARRNAPDSRRKLQQRTGHVCNADAGELSDRVRTNDAIVEAAMENRLALGARVGDIPIKADSTGPAATILGTSVGVVGVNAATIYIGAEHHLSEALIGTLTVIGTVAILALAMWVSWLRSKMSTCQFKPAEGQKTNMKRRNHGKSGGRKKKGK